MTGTSGDTGPQRPEQTRRKDSMARTPKAAAEKKTAKAMKKPAPKKAADKMAEKAAALAPHAPRRQAIVVLAMHRTGSSALTRVLNLLGCDLPKTLMGGDASNETGHWESTVIRALNDDILASGGSDWQDWRAFNPRWYDTPRPAEFAARAADILDEEYGPASILVFKDPRICRIFPFWRKVFKTQGVGLQVILTLRHPVEVAASLGKRNALAEVHGLLLWLRHMIDAEHASRGVRRAVVAYETMLAQPVETARKLEAQLGLAWPRLSDSVSEEIDRFMTPGLRHHRVAPQEGFAEAQMLRPWLAEVYGIFHRWAETGEDRADWPALDAIRSSMDALARPMTEIVAALVQLSQGVAGKDKELGYLRGEAGKRGDRVAALTA